MCTLEFTLVFLIFEKKFLTKCFLCHMKHKLLRLFDLILDHFHYAHLELNLSSLYTCSRIMFLVFIIRILFRIENSSFHVQKNPLRSTDCFATGI